MWDILDRVIEFFVGPIRAVVNNKENWLNRFLHAHPVAGGMVLLPLVVLLLLALLFLCNSSFYVLSNDEDAEFYFVIIATGLLHVFLSRSVYRIGERIRGVEHVPWGNPDGEHEYDACRIAWAIIVTILILQYQIRHW